MKNDYIDYDFEEEEDKDEYDPYVEEDETPEINFDHWNFETSL